MDRRQGLFKAGPRGNPTLSERVRRKNSQRVAGRQTRFAAGRQIPLDDSPGTPGSAPKQTKISKIANRNDQLKAFRIQKNLQKVRQVQEERSPFIATVPAGRWVQKKEKPQFNFANFNDTPVRNAVLTERVLKKSTVKQLMAKSTMKKENLMVFEGRKNAKPAVKSKKQILGELNAVGQQAVAAAVSGSKEQGGLNDTFEFSPTVDDKPVAAPTKRLRRSNSMPEIAPKEKFVMTRKIMTPPMKAGAVLKKMRVKPVITKPVITKPVITKPVVTKPVVVQKPLTKPVPARRQPVSKTLVQAEKAAPVLPPAESSMDPSFAPLVWDDEPTHDEEPIIEQNIEPPRSHVFNLYKSSMDVQISYLTLQIEDTMGKMDKFMDELLEDQQMFVHVTIQQGNAFIAEKLKKFGELLEQYEADQSNPAKPLKNRLTEDDVENYWFLIYEELAKVKSDLSKVNDMKNLGMKNLGLAILTSQKKRRTRRTYIAENGTPKKSARIATNADTPKHNTSCSGCVPMSASKMNTSKSATKRRTTMKKSVLFEELPDSAAGTVTPKRSDTRRTTKRYKATPKRNLLRMNAIEIETDDEVDGNLL